MNKFTSFASVALTLLLLAGLGVTSALAQGVEGVFVDPNGTATTGCTDVADPCSLTAGISAASDSVYVRVRSDGGTTVFDDGLTLGTTALVFAVYERSGSAAEKSKGTIQFNGNSTISANLQIAKDVTVHLAGDEVSVTANGDASVSATMHDVGNLMLGTSSGTQTLEFTNASSCNTDGTSVDGDNTFNNVVVSGDVDVRCSSSAETPSGFTITNSLVVNSGTLDLGGFDVTVMPTAPAIAALPKDQLPRGKVEIKSRVEGRGDFTLTPQGEMQGPATGDDVEKVFTDLAALTLAQVEDIGAETDPTEIPAGIAGKVIQVIATSHASNLAANDDRTEVGGEARYPVDVEVPQLGVITGVIQHIATSEDYYPGDPATDANAGEDSLWYVTLNVNSGGFANTHSGCFKVSGGGTLAMNLVKEGAAGACVELSAIGRGGISQNKAGALYVTKATQLNGKFIHGERTGDGTAIDNGIARTEFWKLAMLDGDLEIFGEDDPLTDGTASQGYVGSDMVQGNDACDAAGMTGRSTGVHFFSGVTITGDVLLRDTDNAGAECAEGLWFRGDSEPDKDTNAASAADKKGAAVSTVKGVFEMDSSYVRLGSHNFYHSLVLEDDLYTTTTADDAAARIDFTAPAEAAMYDTNVCGTSSAPNRRGNTVTFMGDVSQDINLGAKDLALPSVVVNKASGSKLSIKGGGNIVSASLVEVLSGTLETNGKLNPSGSAVVVNQSSGAVGSVSRGDGTNAYMGTTQPAVVHYTGSRSQDTGDELVLQADGKAMVLDGLEVYKAAGKELALMTDVQVSKKLKLTSGTLVLQEATLTLVDNTMVIMGEGDLGFPSDDDLQGKFTVPTKDKQMIDLKYIGTEARMAGMLWQPTDTGPGAAARRIQHVTIDSACKDGHPVISLGEGWSQLSGDLTITDGALDINGQHLIVFADKDTRSQVTIGDKAYLCDSGAGVGCTKASAYRDPDVTDDVSAALADFLESDYASNREALRASLVNLRAARTAAAKTADEVTSMVHIVGNGDTGVAVGTSKDRLSVALPYVIVKRNFDAAAKRTGKVTFSAGGTASTTSGNVPPNMVDEIMLLGYTQEHGNVEVANDVDVLKAMNGFTLKKNTFTMTPHDNSGATTGAREPRQMLSVGMDYMQTGGSFAGDQKGGVTVYGDFMQGAMPDSAGVDPGIEASFDLGGGMHTVMGDFRVGASVHKDTMNVYMLGGGDMCTEMPPATGAATPAALMVAGDYHFAGIGDRSNETNYTAGQMGLRGNVTFVGESDQTVWHGYGAETQFCDVTINTTGDGMIMLASDGVQSAEGMLTLKSGVINGGDNEWMIQNDNLEENLVGRNTADPEGDAAVHLGSRDSYVNGVLSRAVSKGNAGGGVVGGGYLFPVGEAADTTADRQVAHFRPLIMQLPDDLGSTNTVMVEYQADMTADDVQWPESGIVTDADGGGNLLLDAVADMFWKVEFKDGIPAHDPNIRVVASGLSNVFNVKGLRLVQFDCDGSDARLAGVYDLTESETDDESFASNDFVNGVPNLTQEGVEVDDCNVFGVASNFLANPITLDPISGGLATVQFIHNVAGADAIDVYLDGNRVLDNWTYRSATGFVPVVHGDHTLEVVAPTAPDNSVPLFTQTITVEQHRSYNVIAHGVVTDFAIVTVPDVRMEAIGDNLVDFYVVHGAAQLGEVDIRLIDPIDNTRVLDLLANNIDFKDVGAYLSLAPGGYNLEVTTANNDRQIAVWRLELQQFRDQAFVLNLSGAGKTGAEGLGMLGVETNGDTFLPNEITATEAAEELPTEFVLEGNYPNPFNPATKIQFDLPENSQVRVEIIDMLGRSVMTVPAREIEAGHSRGIDVHAAELASGAYLYRLIAISATGTQVKTGRMMLIK